MSMSGTTLGFFVEIVQRRAYDRCGAVDRPARMAAQVQNAKDKA